MDITNGRNDQIAHELDCPKPRSSPHFLTRAEKDRCIERSLHSLYRWYVASSQTKRNWNPDTGFEWRRLSKTHSAPILQVIQGFFAVEQYAPDYTAQLVMLTRRNYGRSQFQVRWGAEEAKHADLWRNTLIFSGFRDGEWLDHYTEELRSKAWTLPWDTPIHMLLYTVLQERATELNYLNLAKIARGEAPLGDTQRDVDPVLAHVATTIAVDEAAHYNFFLEAARVYLYYYPEKTLEALVDVIRHFTMPASDIVVDYDVFISSLYDSQVFGRTIYARDIVRTALASLGVDNLKRVEQGVAQSKRAPDGNGAMTPHLIDGFSLSIIESAVVRLFDRLDRHEEAWGLPEHERLSWRLGTSKSPALEGNCI